MPSLLVKSPPTCRMNGARRNEAPRPVFTSVAVPEIPWPSAAIFFESASHWSQVVGGLFGSRPACLNSVLL